jgi:hypothetical protein
MMSWYMKATFLVMICSCGETKSIDPFHAFFMFYNQQKTINRQQESINELVNQCKKIEKRQFQEELESLQKIKKNIVSCINRELFLYSSLSDSIAYHHLQKNSEYVELKTSLEILEKTVSSLAQDVEKFKKLDKKSLYLSQLYNLSLERAEQAKINLIRDITWYKLVCESLKITPYFAAFWQFFSDIQLKTKLLLPDSYARYGIYEHHFDQEFFSFYTRPHGLRDIAKIFFSTIIGKNTNVHSLKE